MLVKMSEPRYMPHPRLERAMEVLFMTPRRPRAELPALTRCDPSKFGVGSVFVDGGGRGGALRPLHGGATRRDPNAGAHRDKKNVPDS